MTKRNSGDVQLFMIGGYDILDTLTTFEDTWDVTVEETHSLGDAWVERSYTGVRTASITQEGFYDDAVGSVHDALSAGLGAQSRVLCYGVEGTATGAAFVGFNGALEVKYVRLPARAELTKARAEYQGDGIVDGGKVVRWHNIATASGDSTGSPIDNGVSSTWGGAAYLQVSRVDAMTNMTNSILHSADNITYAALTTFTAVTSSTMPTAQRSAVAAGTVINRYLADRRVFTAPGAGASVKYFTGFARFGAT